MVLKVLSLLQRCSALSRPVRLLAGQTTQLTFVFRTKPDEAAGGLRMSKKRGKRRRLKTVRGEIGPYFLAVPW